MSHDEQVLATGIAKETFKEIHTKTRGMAVKTKDYIARHNSLPEKSLNHPFKRLSDIARLNESYIHIKL